MNLTRDEKKLSRLKRTEPLFSQEVRTCRIMCRNAKTRDPLLERQASPKTNIVVDHRVHPVVISRKTTFFVRARVASRLL